MSEQKKLSVWTYIYTHKKTEGATGYFSCEPEVEESFYKALAKLASRPMDSFLHQKLLNALLEVNEDRWTELAKLCLDKSLTLPSYGHENKEELSKILSCLLLECAILIDDCRKVLSNKIGDLYKKAGDVLEASPFPHILKLWERKSGKAFGAYGKAIQNLQEISPGRMPLLEEALNEEVYRNLFTFKKNAKLLKKLYKTFIPPTPSSVIMPAEELIFAAKERLEKAGLLHGPEMRHEASLSPIALLRQWLINIEVKNGRHSYILKGLATAYGRGLSLVHARASCLMEIVERASAYASVAPGGKYGFGQVVGLTHDLPLLYANAGSLRASGYRLFIPAQGDAGIWDDVPLYWLEGSDARGQKLFVPAQAVFLFSNLDELSLYEQAASTGLGSGTSFAQAKLAALTEILERDANATSLHHYRDCFIPKSRNEMIQGLLDDYRVKRIFLYMQDISNESAFPVYRCIVRDTDGQAHYSTAASLDAKRAALSALTETPWPYSWSSPFPSSQLSAPPPPNIPSRYLEDLPNYSFGNVDMDLALIEQLLTAQGQTPVYVDISRADLQFPVIRAFIPNMESNGEYDASMPPGPRFLARNYLYGKNYF